MSDGPAPIPEVVRVGTQYIDVIARVLAAAFDDDPVFNWFVRQDERRSSAFEQIFREGLRLAHLPNGECYMTADQSAVAVWRPPSGYEPPEHVFEAVFDEITGSPLRRRR